MANKWESNPEIQRFREYLRIPTVQPNVDYTECVEFLTKQADIDESGKIFARGTQDMKSVGTQYLGAIKALKNSGKHFKRTIHITFVPEEEIGSDDGMRVFVKSEAFRKLNVGFAFDEGIASPDETFPVFYAERTIWKVRFTCRGTSGHGSLLHENTAAEKLRHILNRAMDYRNEQMNKLKNNLNLAVGDVTTVNLVIVNGGVLNNIVPPSIMVLFDCRLAIDVDYDAFENMLRTWCAEAGSDVDVEFDAKFPKVPPTVIDDSNPFWKAFHETMVNDLHLKIQPLVFPGRTDSCFIREVGIPALGFSPMNHTPVLLHDNDEYVSADVYLNGISIYTKLIEKVASA